MFANRLRPLWAHRQCQVRSRPPACSVPPGTSATRRHHHHHHHRHPSTIANTSPTTTTCYSGCYGAGRLRTSCFGDDELQPPGVQRPPSWLVLQTNQQLLASAPVGRSARPTNWDAADQAQVDLEIAGPVSADTESLPLSTGPCWPSTMQGDWFPEGRQQHRFIDSGLVDLSSGFLWVQLGTVHRNSLRVMYNAAGQSSRRLIEGYGRQEVKTLTQCFSFQIVSTVEIQFLDGARCFRMAGRCARCLHRFMM